MPDTPFSKEASRFYQGLYLSYDLNCSLGSTCYNPCQSIKLLIGYLEVLRSPVFLNKYCLSKSLSHAWGILQPLQHSAAGTI